MIGNLHYDVLDRMKPCSNRFYNFFITSLASIMNWWYNPKFHNGKYGNRQIMCSTSLLGSNPLSSWNTSMFHVTNLINTTFFSWYTPLGMNLLSLTLLQDDFLLKSKTYFLLELISFLAWLAVTNEIFGLPLCTLMMKDFTSLMRHLWLALHMKISSHMYI